MATLMRLPHVSVGRVFALIEVMDRTEGPDDVFRLGQALMLGLDKLLPLLEAVKLLGWASVTAGDYDLTAEGQRGDVEAERQVDTAVDWGRQAELFDYDADEGFFRR
jgi:hypothetical protein